MTFMLSAFHFYGMYMDPLYLVVLLGTLVMSGLATAWVKWAFNKYADVPSQAGMTGAECAQAILSRYGIEDVKVERSNGMLSDHYSPSEKALRLSPDVHDGTSLSALGVAAHECGHALQHAQGYIPLYVRSGLVPFAKFGSYFSFILILIGVFIQATGMIYLGIGAFALTTAFAFVTLPVEFNASSRALAVLQNEGILANQQELSGVKSVLRAAASTYVAAALTSLAWLLYYIIRFTSDR